jgi:uncharacterized protein (DUF427 family)
MRVRAIWNGQLLAESADTVVVEGNHYFPAASLDKRFFTGSDTHTVCPWKGTAHYYTVIVNGNRNEDAAWFYPETSEEADHIKGRVAFWNGVDITE